MEHAVGGAAARAATQPRHAPVYATQFRAASQPWILGALATVVLLVPGLLVPAPLMVALALVLGALTVRSGWRLVSSLRRLDDVGLTRWAANVAMMLLPPQDARRPHGVAHVPVPDGLERTPEAILRHVLGDESRRPTVAPWIAPRGEAPLSGATGPTRSYWIVPLASAFGLLITMGIVWGGADDATARGAQVVATVLATLPVPIGLVAVLAHRVEVHDDGRLRIRRLTGWRELRLDRLLQVSGWTWSIDTRRPVEGRPRLHGHTMSLVFGDGGHAVLQPMHARDDELIGQALRWWVLRTGAAVTPDAAYGLGLTDDPREPAMVQVVHDDRWMRRPVRRVRTAAVHVLAATCLFHPVVLGLTAFFVLR